jgi:hypothetical protein
MRGVDMTSDVKGRSQCLMSSLQVPIASHCPAEEAEQYDTMVEPADSVGSCL